MLHIDIIAWIKCLSEFPEVFLKTKGSVRYEG